MSDHPHPSSRTLRRTGRTTRMLEAAASLIRAGRSVLVVVPGPAADCHRQLVYMFLDMGGDDLQAARFAVVSYEAGGIDWARWRHRRYGHLYDEMFVDHHVCEEVLQRERLFLELHRFDPLDEPSAPEPPRHKPNHDIGHTGRRISL